jgi:CBS-domain-containing membrane protein
MSTESATSSSSADAEAAPWSRPLREFPGLVHLAPPLNHPEDSLGAVIETFSRDHGAGAVFVVDADDHLLGCIPEQALDADLVTVVLPQRLWPAVREMDTRDVLRAARAPRLKAGDLMVGVRCVTPGTVLIDAVGQMVRSRQSMAPLLDEQGRLLGYVRLFDLLAHFLRNQ